MNLKKLKDISHGRGEHRSTQGCDFEIEKGEICVIVGASGAGKTTLLNILGGMDSLTSGRIVLDGKEISPYNANELTTYRRYDVGFVFQFYNLVQNLTAIENVELAAQICKTRWTLRRSSTLSVCTTGRRISSAAFRRRAAARCDSACAGKNRKLMLCDEPTGALDYNTARQYSSFCRIAAGKTA